VWIDYRNGQPDIYIGTISYLPITAFSASPASGKHPLNVKFTDKSSDAYYWSWDFGDKTTSTLPSPSHQYKKAGKFTVSLTVKNAAGKSTAKKTNYITVK
jgi:PKD repeat protein